MRTRAGRALTGFAALGAVGGAPAFAQSGCALPHNDAVFIQRALDAWQQVTSRILRLPAEPVPWIILFSRTCAYHVQPDTTLPAGRAPQPVALRIPLRFNGEAVVVRSESLTDSVLLPTGTRLPANGIAFTSVYTRDGALMPYFLTAMPDVWAHDPRFANDKDNGPEFVLDVLAHELTHTRQIVAVARRADSLSKRFPVLPKSLDDDIVQREFATSPEADAMVRAEIALFFAAAREPDTARARELARQALALLRVRRGTYFGEHTEAYSAVEDLFLNMEGVASLAAYRALAGRTSRGESGQTLLDRFRGGRKFWSQEEGLAVFLLIERFVVNWTARVFPPELASPVDLLDAAVRR